MSGEKEDASQRAESEPSQHSSAMPEEKRSSDLARPLDEDNNSDGEKSDDQVISLLRSVVRDELKNALSQGTMEISVSQQRSVQFPSTGPFPPDLIAEWADVDSEAPAKLLEIQKREQSFRHRRTYIGQGAGILTLCLSAGFGIYLASEKQYVLGLSAFVIGSSGANVGPLIKYIVDRMPRPHLSWKAPPDNKNDEVN